jgi:hypothetical protein
MGDRSRRPGFLGKTTPKQVQSADGCQCCIRRCISAVKSMVPSVTSGSRRVLPDSSGLKCILPNYLYVVTRMEIACERAGRGRFRVREIEHVEVTSRY